MALSPHVRSAIVSIRAGARELRLCCTVVGDAGAEALAPELATSTTLEALGLPSSSIGPTGARAIASGLAQSAALVYLDLDNNDIGDDGARALAAALEKNASLTRLDLWGGDIGAEGARALVAALETNRTLQVLWLGAGAVDADIEYLMADRLRVNRLSRHVAAWVVSAVARRVELWDDTLVLPPALASRAAVLAFGDELLGTELPGLNPWLTPGGREFAAAHQLPRAETALRHELQRLADGAAAPSCRAPRRLPAGLTRLPGGVAAQPTNDYLQFQVSWLVRALTGAITWLAGWMKR